MSGFILRGMRNAFRNTVRTISVIFILSISIGLSLIMLTSYTTVQAKIESVKSSIGNMITITPAGANGFQGGGNPLTTDQVTQIKSISHIIQVVASLSDRLAPTTDTSLVSAIDPGTIGNRNGSFGRRAFGGFSGFRDSSQPQTFSVPIIVTGISDPTSLSRNGLQLVSGSMFVADSKDHVPIIGKGLAAKNNLSVNGTFTAYNGTTIKVVGIYDAGNTFANANMYMPLTTLQTLSGQDNTVTSVIATVDSINNVQSAASAISTKLGSSTVDVTTSQDQANQALAPLESIQSISLYSLVGALLAGAVITLLTMMMIVRERKREIGILKAIGASNLNVVLQFVSESFVFALISSIVGVVAGVLLSNPVLNVLLKSTQTTVSSGQGGGFARFRAFSQVGGGIASSINSLHSTVGYTIILYGILAAIIIAILGSAIPAFLISRIRPAEVMRSE